MQQYTRWYDQDNQLKVIMETLEQMEEDVQVSVALDLIQMVLGAQLDDSDGVIEKINETYFPIRRRWYDRDETVHSAVELLKHIDKNERKDLLTEIIYSIIYFKQQNTYEGAQEEL